MTSAQPINFIGVNGDGITSTILVVLAGTQTITGTGTHTFTNINFLGSVNSAFIFSGGGTMSTEFQNCTINTFANSGISQTSGDLNLKIDNCNVFGATYACLMAGNNTQSYCTDVFFSGNVNSAFNQTSATPGSSQFVGCRFQGSSFGIESGASQSLDLKGCTITSSSEAVTIAAGGQVRLLHTYMLTSAGSGFTVTGTGQLVYDSIYSEGNTTLDPALTLTPIDWQPYAQMATAPATPAGGQGLRGTCCFDDTQFTVTSGFVQLSTTGVAATFTSDAGIATPVANNINILGGSGVTTSASGDTITVNSVVWTDQIASVGVTADSGTFDASAGTATFTLPAAPSQGEECRFVCINSGGVIRANAGQQISIGNQNSTVAGTATSTAGGDSVWLTYNAGTLRWFSVATNGNWTLA